MGNTDTAVGQLSRMLYMDDSGSALYGLTILGWVEVAPRDWPQVLRVARCAQEPGPRLRC